MKKTPGRAAPDAVNIQDSSEFLVEFASAMMGAGAQPSRVARNIERLGASLGMCADLIILSRHIIVTMFHEADHAARRTAMGRVNPRGIDFAMAARLNALSWEAHDSPMALDELRRRFEAIAAEPPRPWWLVLLLASLGNAAFCRLFEGDWAAAGIVLGSTVVAFFVRRWMLRAHMDTRFVFFTAAFVASLAASLAVAHIPTGTPQIALGTSVLFLIPGVALINAVNDTLEGHILTGFSRGVDACIIIICISLGLSVTLLLTGGWAS